jgi:hypothetical protein
VPFPNNSSEWKKFLEVSESALSHGLVLLFGEQERIQIYDFDRLLTLGVRLARSSFSPANLSRIAVQWLNAHPTERRLGIVSAFFTGLWKYSTSDSVAADADVRTYKALIQSIQPDEEADNVEQSLLELRKHLNRMRSS